MTEQLSPITPPPELVQQWRDATRNDFYQFESVATKAARWGAHQGLEACRQFLEINGVPSKLIYMMMSARRPEPPSQAEQALDALKDLDQRYPASHQAVIVRAALERLRELERTAGN
jgi:propanediol dehydratase small subunit